MLGGMLILLFSFKIMNKWNSSEHINIMDKREIFIDNYLIEEMNGASLVKHAPKDEGAVLFFDKSWEGPYSAYCTVIEDNGLYRLYYRGDGTICYAESKDGHSWSKPNLGLHRIKNSSENNVIIFDDYPVTHNFSPFLDKNPKVNAFQKYKAVGGKDSLGLMAYTSADGIRWTKLQQKPIITKGAFDSQNVAFWSEEEGQYICYFRIWSEGNFIQKRGFRTIARTTSKDFINWTEPVAMSFGDTPMEHFYTQQTSPYFRAPHIYIAIGARFMPGRKVINENQAKEIGVNLDYYNDCSDVYLMSSRGGDKYDRYFMESFIRPGIGLSNWSSRTNYPALNIVQTGETEMSIYIAKNYAQKNAHLSRYSMRIDGISSIESGYYGGYVISKTLLFSGSELEINYSTSAAGEIRIELLDEHGLAIAGYTHDDCDPIIGDEISKMVSWRGKKNLGHLTSTPIRLKIYLKDANLFSFKFRN